MAINSILTVNDFNTLLDQSAGREVTRTPVTKTVSNISGQETLTEGTAELIKVHFVRTNQRWDYDKAGLVEQGDAIMLSKYADAVAKDDKITVNSENYRVQERYDVAGYFDSAGSDTEYVYTVCSLFKYD